MLNNKKLRYFPLYIRVFFIQYPHILSSHPFYPMVTIYSKDYCPYCVMAKNLLKNLDIPFEEIDITRSPEIMEELMKKSRMMTVPQIFVGDKCLGGYDDINALHKKGELVELCK